MANGKTIKLVTQIVQQVYDNSDMKLEKHLTTLDHDQIAQTIFYYHIDHPDGQTLASEIADYILTITGDEILYDQFIAASIKAMKQSKFRQRGLVIYKAAAKQYLKHANKDSEKNINLIDEAETHGQLNALLNLESDNESAASGLRYGLSIGSKSLPFFTWLRGLVVDVELMEASVLGIILNVAGQLLSVILTIIAALVEEVGENQTTLIITNRVPDMKLNYTIEFDTDSGHLVNNDTDRIPHKGITFSDYFPKPFAKTIEDQMNTVGSTTVLYILPSPTQFKGTLTLKLIDSSGINTVDVLSMYKFTQPSTWTHADVRYELFQQKISNLNTNPNPTVYYRTYINNDNIYSVGIQKSGPYPGVFDKVFSRLSLWLESGLGYTTNPIDNNIIYYNDILHLEYYSTEAPKASKLLYDFAFPNKAFLIKARHSGKVLTIGDALLGNQSRLVQGSDNNTANQCFTLEKADKGYYFIKNLNSGKYLDCQDGQVDQQIVQNDFSGSDSQQWKFKYGINEYYYIKSKLGNLNIDVKGSDTNDGASAIIYSPTDTLNQQFTLENVFDPYFDTSGRAFFIWGQDSPNVLDIFQGSTEEGASIINFERHGGRNQLFQIEYVSNGYFLIFNVKSNKLLTNDKGKLVQHSINNQDNQKWSIQPSITKNGIYYTIASKVGDHPAISVNSNSETVELKPLDNSESQNFKLTEVLPLYQRFSSSRTDSRTQIGDQFEHMYEGSQSFVGYVLTSYEKDTAPLYERFGSGNSNGQEWEDTRTQVGSDFQDGYQGQMNFLGFVFTKQRTGTKGLYSGYNADRHDSRTQIGNKFESSYKEAWFNGYIFTGE